MTSCYVTGDPTTARELYELAVEQQPDNAVAHAALGLLLLGTVAIQF